MASTGCDSHTAVKTRSLGVALGECCPRLAMGSCGGHMLLPRETPTLFAAQDGSATLPRAVLEVAWSGG